MADDARTDEALRAAPEQWWAPSLRGIRFLLGAVTLVGGLFWSLVNLTGPNPLLDLTIGLVLAAGALVLLMPHRVQLPQPVTLLVALAAGLVGTAAGLLAKSEQECCMFGYVMARGWPFSWVERGAAAADPDTARRLAQDAGWQVNLVSLGANLLVSAYAGLLLLVVVVLVRRARRGSGEPQPE